MIDQFINFIIRPPRAQYNPDQYLWEKEFILAGKKYQRKDLELKNARGYTLQCSHYLPLSVPEDISLPCVIYCHGNSGCRADANEAAVILLPSNITVFTLDFSGSGLSDGEHVSLGWHEKEDLKMVVSYLRENKQVSRIGLWGRSMGAVTCLLYGAEDPSIAGMVLDSAFSNLYGLMMELVDVYKIFRLPKFTLKMIVQYMRRVIEKKAKFDIMDLNCLQAAPKTLIPVLFGHANDDNFIHPHHSDLISEFYGGDKNTIKFEGDHNSTRPQIFYDSVCIFFYNVLRPPHIPRARRFETYYSMRHTRVSTTVDEDVLNDIFSSLCSSTTDAASSSFVSPTISNSIPPSVSEILGRIDPVTESGIREETTHDCGEPVDSKDGQNSSTEDYFSYCGSTRESLSGDNDYEVFATPSGSMRETLEEQKEGEKNQKKKKKKAETVGKKLKPDRFEKLESFSRRLRLCILKGSTHRRHNSS